MSAPLLLLFGFLTANTTAILFFILIKRAQKQNYRIELDIRSAIGNAVLKGEPPSPALKRLLIRRCRASLRELAALHGAIVLSREEHSRAAELFEAAGLRSRLQRGLSSPLTRKRYASALYLRFLLRPDQRLCLAQQLKREKRSHVRIALVKGLLQGEQDFCFDAIAESLAFGGAYARSVAKMMGVSGYRFIGWARRRSSTEDSRYKRAILYGARVHSTSWLQEYAFRCLEDEDPLVREAAAGCAQVYPEILAGLADTRTDPDIRALAVLAEAGRFAPLNLKRFIRFFDDPVTFDAGVEGLREYLSRFPEEIDRVLALQDDSLTPAQRRGTALSLAGRLPFLLTSRQDIPRLAPVITEAVKSGYCAGIVAFLNSNRDLSTQEELLSILAPLAAGFGSFRENCIRYLDPELKQKLGITQAGTELNSPRIPLSRGDRRLLLLLLSGIILIPVGLLFALYEYPTARFPLLLFTRYSVRSFTAVFAVYTVALNSIYLILLGLAVFNLRRQNRYWLLQDREFLFTPGVVPSVAIIAPAYNEEKTVIESVNSLLTLVYPDYQVIVVNDGSKDRTIDVLIEEFQLIRIDHSPEAGINTAPVRGVYRSPLNRRLLVVDKENGGKADALNCGINIAEKEYICSIDSDSLLEPDSLLRMTTEALTSRRETIAVGGNILPINGCGVEHGALQSIALGNNRFVRLQTIEYLRSFIAGRLGWAQANSLLIISGAFGLFSRKRVIEIGGYLTGRGVHSRDTVGEDMELVVRLIRHMGDKGRPYKVSYAASANCWTEVPEELGSIYRQRDRWHRGLVEIMTYHRGMIFNPRYGAAGLIALPYFLIFEFIGPFYEFAGYIALIAGFAGGVLSFPVFLTMFSVVVLFGMLISLISLILSEYGIVYFRWGEIARLIGATVTESFGYRQIMGWVRVFAFVGMFFSNKGWQKLERKGFSTGKN
jgi:peptidoglycan-N-acetylglucosamine deacetylase